MTAFALAGCANPGPPRPPSLHLPQPVGDLSAKRIGNIVELRFTVPSRSTDKLPLHGTIVQGEMCREVEHQGCVVIGQKMDVAIAGSGRGHNTVAWHDALPAELTTSRPRLLGYRVEFFSPAGHSAGKSNVACAVAGEAPPPVEGLHAEGSRLGVVLRWSMAANTQGNIVVRREEDAPKKAAGKNDVVLLAAHASHEEPDTLDTSAKLDVPYRYSAVRKLSMTLGGHVLTMQSEESASVAFTLQPIYPPPAPTGLAAEGYTNEANAASSYSVDLIWQPVDDAGLITKFAGYNVYRSGGGTGEMKTRLNAAPVPVPAFHDASAQRSTAYTYSVTAVDVGGNESNATPLLLYQTPSQ